MRSSAGLTLLVLTLWSAAANAQTPLSPETPMILSWTPAQQRQWYPAMESVFDTRTVARGDAVRPLPRARVQIAPTFDLNGHTWTLDDYIAAYNVSGVLVLKDGKVLLERYGMGRKPSDRWTSFSVAKSVTSILAGAAIQDGRLKQSDLVSTHIPELKGSAYDGVSVRNLMTMSSGVKWNEDYVWVAHDMSGFRSRRSVRFSRSGSDACGDTDGTDWRGAWALQARRNELRGGGRAAGDE